MKVHISWIGLVALKVWQNVVARSVQPLLNASISALFHKWILRLIGLFLLAVALVMMCTMSWSATPGAGKHLSTSDGRFVKNKSSVSLCLVGKLTICSRPQFWVQSSSLWLIATALEFPSTLSEVVLECATCYHDFTTMELYYQHTCSDKNNNESSKW
jgi:hypothetical protein